MNANDLSVLKYVEFDATHSLSTPSNWVHEKRFRRTYNISLNSQYD